VVVVAALSFGRLLFTSHTTHYQPVNHPTPTLPAHFTLPAPIHLEPVEKPRAP
jgi:hypothetical protein